MKCFTLKYIMTLSWRKQIQRQNLAPHSLEDNVVLSTKLSLSNSTTYNFLWTYMPEWFTYFKQLLFTYYIYSSSSIFSLKIILLALTFHYVIVKIKLWPFCLQVSQAIRTNARAKYFQNSHSIFIINSYTTKLLLSLNYSVHYISFFLN